MRTLAILGAFVRRDFAVALSYRLSMALEVVAVVFSLTLFFYLGQLFDESSLASRPGLERGYFAFVVVGLSLLQIVQTGLASFTTKIRLEQTTGTFEAVIATPTSPSTLIIGSAAYELLRATVLGLLMFGCAVLVFGLSIEGGWAVVLFSVVGLAASIAVFAALGVAIAAFTVVFKQTASLIGLVVSGLALLGGVYFPIEVMPAPLEALAKILPFTWALDVLRSALLAGDADVERLVLLVSSAVLALPAALFLFGRALRHARQQGSLSQY